MTGHIVGSPLHLEAGVHSLGVDFVLPGQGQPWAASGLTEAAVSTQGLARGPEPAVRLRANLVPDSGQLSGTRREQRPLLPPLPPTSSSANQDTLGSLPCLPREPLGGSLRLPQSPAPPVGEHPLKAQPVPR